MYHLRLYSRYKDKVAIYSDSKLEEGNLLQMETARQVSPPGEYNLQQVQMGSAHQWTNVLYPLGNITASALTA